MDCRRLIAGQVLSCCHQSIMNEACQTMVCFLSPAVGTLVTHPLVFCPPGWSSGRVGRWSVSGRGQLVITPGDTAPGLSSSLSSCKLELSPQLTPPFPVPRMTPNFRLVVTAVAVTAMALTSTSCNRLDNEGSTNLSSIDSLFADFAQPGMPGAAVVVIRDGGVVALRTYGLADVETLTPVTSATNFRLASLSKAFTAMSVMILAADGRLTFDDHVSKYLPELPRFASGVTLRHLLSHTSGLHDYEDFVPDTQTYQVKDADVLALVVRDTTGLYFEPGTQWRYSNTGYALLALVVQRVSGERYAAFLKKRIFDPLGMKGTVAFEQDISTVGSRAYGYRVRGDSVQRTDQSNTSAVLGDGGIYSSIDDLVRWDAELSDVTLIPDSLWREATMPFILRDGRAADYGFGWFIDEFDGHLRHRHHGETRGFTNSIYRFPDARLTTIVLTNRTGSSPWDRNDEMVRRYLVRVTPSNP